jgi:hypothetical protein
METSFLGFSNSEKSTKVWIANIIGEKGKSFKDGLKTESQIRVQLEIQMVNSFSFVDTRIEFKAFFSVYNYWKYC